MLKIFCIQFIILNDDHSQCAKVKLLLTYNKKTFSTYPKRSEDKDARPK